MSVLPIIRWDQAYNRCGDAKLPRAVVNAIRTHVDNHTLTGWVKAKTLADYTGLSVRAVRRQVAANVKAGWLDVVSGNSSGKANTYRLTYPKGDADVTLPPEKGDADVTLMVSSSAEKGDADVTPTTPRTSPGSSPKRRTTPEKGDADVTLAADPFRGVGGYVPASTTTESKGDADVTLTDDEIAELMTEHRGEAGPVENFPGAGKVAETAERVTKPMPWDEPTECIIRWPAGKPLPKLRDPFAKFVDDATGEQLWPVTGQR